MVILKVQKGFAEDKDPRYIIEENQDYWFFQYDLFVIEFVVLHCSFEWKIPWLNV